MATVKHITILPYFLSYFNPTVWWNVQFALQIYVPTT
jgi:hypothetical protein